MTKVDDLIAQGAVQVSRKHRRVLTIPVSCVEYLKKNHPEKYDSLVEEILTKFETEARSICWSACSEELTTELTHEEFDEFREKTTGKKQWSPVDKEACPDCESLGHMHRRTCKFYK